MEVLFEDETQTPKTKAEAAGLFRKMDTLETAVMTVIWSAVLERFHKVNKIIQSVEIDLGTIEEFYTSLVVFLQEARSNFDHYEEEAKTIVGVDELVAEQ